MAWKQVVLILATPPIQVPILESDSGSDSSSDSLEDSGAKGLLEHTLLSLFGNLWEIRC